MTSKKIFQLFFCFFHCTLCFHAPAPISNTAMSKFLVTVTGGRLSAADVLERLRELVSALNGEAFDINECRLSIQVCDVSATCMNTLGSFQCVCEDGFILEDGISSPCKDFDECLSGKNSCNKFATCVNNVGSYNCTCLDGFYGDGAICVAMAGEEDCSGEGLDCHQNKSTSQEEKTKDCESNKTTKQESQAHPIEVSCTTSSISVTVGSAFYENMNVQLADLHLSDPSCLGEKVSREKWKFPIEENFSSCSTIITENRTHVTYSNVLSNSVREGIFIGSTVSVPFSCSYPTKNITVRLPSSYQPKANLIKVEGPSGNGTFVVKMNLYTDSSYVAVNNDTVFAATDTIYVQIELFADDSSLVLLINDCWATPSADGNDVNQYKFISDGCSIPEAVAGTVKVTKNGVGKTGTFQSQVFGFVDFNTTYLHCTVDLCSLQLYEKCMQNCSTEEKSLAKGRKRRGVNGNMLSLGPFLAGDDKDWDFNGSLLSTQLHTVIVGFVLALLFMATMVIYFVIKHKRTKKKLKETAQSHRSTCSGAQVAINEGETNPSCSACNAQEIQTVSTKV